MPDLSKFPAYTEYDPRVPVHCITPDIGGCIHRFFDTSPISPSGRYLAVFQIPDELRAPAPGEPGTIHVVDLETGVRREVARTCGWEGQLGANINWGGSDEELFFNDVDTATWRPFAWKLNPLTGARQRMEGTVYHASPDGRLLISADLTSMRRLQPGYGVVIPREYAMRNIGASETDGFWATDTVTGKRRLLVSLKTLLTQASPAIRLPEPERHEIYGFHCKFNAQGDRVMLSVRAFPAQAEPQWDMFKGRMHEVRFAWVTMRLDGSEMHCAVGPEQWEKLGHHATWFPDGRRISMNLNIDRDVMRFVQVNADGSGLRKMRDDVIGSGHPTVSPDGTHILTDAYVRGEPASFGDGTVPLRWIDLATGREDCLARITTARASGLAELRVDPHPAWDRSGRYVTFNACSGGTRRVYVADMRSLS